MYDFTKPSVVGYFIPTETLRTAFEKLVEEHTGIAVDLYVDADHQDNVIVLFEGEDDFSDEERCVIEDKGYSFDDHRACAQVLLNQFTRCERPNFVVARERVTGSFYVELGWEHYQELINAEENAHA